MPRALLEESPRAWPARVVAGGPPAAPIGVEQPSDRAVDAATPHRRRTTRPAASPEHQLESGVTGSPLDPGGTNGERRQAGDKAVAATLEHRDLLDASNAVVAAPQVHDKVDARRELAV